MRAILLAAGFGTRLRPLTDSVPKCLVPVKGSPLLGIWLERLLQAGFGPFLVNTHYFAGQVEDFIARSPYRDQVVLVHEAVLLGTAGTLIRNIAFFQGEDGLLLHADNYCLADLIAFRAAHQHRPPGCEITMMVFRTDNPSACGIVETDRDGVVTGFHEKVANPPGDLANGAVYLLSAAALAEIRDRFSSVDDFSNGILPHFIGRVHVHETPEILVDIGTPENYARVNAG